MKILLDPGSFDVPVPTDWPAPPDMSRGCIHQDFPVLCKPVRLTGKHKSERICLEIGYLVASWGIDASCKVPYGEFDVTDVWLPNGVKMNVNAFRARYCYDSVHR